MAKKFAYLSFGVLCLVVAYQLGAARVRADWRGEDVPGLIVAGGGGGSLWLNRTGEVWDLGGGCGGIPGWCLRKDLSAGFPVPLSEIKFFESPGGDVFVLITNNDDGWTWYPSGGWQGPYPFPGAVSVENSSWGDIKGRYKK